MICRGGRLGIGVDVQSKGRGISKLQVKFLVYSQSSTPVIANLPNFFTMTATGKTYIVEHLDPELGTWSELEYLAIARESQDAGAKFCLSSLPQTFQVPEALKNIPAFTAETRSVEELYAKDKSRVCLLDPAAASDLAPEDGDKFDAFLFGGILGVFHD